jgi:hypothetical protein
MKGFLHFYTSSVASSFFKSIPLQLLIQP